MPYTVVLCLSTPVNGQMRQYATDEAVKAAIEQFGHATTVERLDDEWGARYRVTCPDQRGEAGAHRLHAIACDHRIPVHIE